MMLPTFLTSARWRTAQPRFCLFCRIPAAADDWTRPAPFAPLRLLRYHVAVGPSFTLFWQAATTIVADIYVDQSVSRRAADTVGLELGARYRVSPQRLASPMGPGPRSNSAPAYHGPKCL
jgi:hypothetical protein